MKMPKVQDRSARLSTPTAKYLLANSIARYSSRLHSIPRDPDSLCALSGQRTTEDDKKVPASFRMAQTDGRREMGAEHRKENDGLGLDWLHLWRGLLAR